MSAPTRFVSVLACLAFFTSASTVRAGDADDVAAGLKNFTERLDALGSFGPLGNNLPMTDFSPVSLEGLRLDELFSRTLWQCADRSVCGRRRAQAGH